LPWANVRFCSAGILPASSNRRKPGAAQRILGLPERAGGVVALSILAIASSGESHQQDELSPVNKVKRERGAQSALRMPLRRISHIAVMSRRFSTRQKLIPLNLTNYQLPLFRMHPPRKGYPQDALFAGNKVELSPLYKVHRERAIFLVTFRPSRFKTRKQPQPKSREICTCKTKELSILK